MAASPHLYTLADREMLRAALVWKSGVQLDGKSACIRMSEVLRSGGRYAPSGTTLYHLFVATGGSRRPYLETLHALSRYLGYSDWHAFRQNTGKGSGIPVPMGRSHVVYPDLFAICLRSGRFEVIDEFLDNWRERLEDPLLYDVGLVIYRALRCDASLELPFYERYAGHPAARKAFFEFLADPDLRLVHADEGLRRYREVSGPVADQQGIQGRLLDRAMLSRYHLLPADPRTKELGSDICTDGTVGDALPATHLFPAMRYLAYAVWYDLLGGQRSRRRSGAVSRVIERVATCLQEERSELERNILFHTLVEALLRERLLDRVKPELARLFPEVDPDVYSDAGRLGAVLARRDHNVLNALQHR
jgi:hypothetical protein